MRAPGFWFRPPRHPLSRLLGPVGRIYGERVADRMDRVGTPPPCPVLCVGNFTLGGAGKTPTALALAALLRDLGRSPAFLSRGYGGRLAGPVVVDAARHGATEVGDEPLLLAACAPTIVARDRPAGAHLCRETGADVIVMDDGLQNPSLSKSLSLAVVDGGVGIGNGCCFPAGPLRAPLVRQWPHVAGLVLVGEGIPGERLAREAHDRGLPVHRARLAPVELSGWRRHRVVAFAGIGRPRKFFETLRSLGAEIVGERAFADHHRYRPAELTALIALAERERADLVTTEKDAVRLPASVKGQVRSLRVAMDFADADSLRRQIAGALSEPRRDP